MDSPNQLRTAYPRRCALFPGHRPLDRDKGFGRVRVDVHTAATLGVAAVWLHQGLWCKVMRGCPSHHAIVASVPGIGDDRARVFELALGLVEGGVASWLLTGRSHYRTALVQTLLVAGMNAGGLLVGSQHIENRWRMVARNIAFVGAIWLIPARRSCA